jgi:hypothetical protein
VLSESEAAEIIKTAFEKITKVDNFMRKRKASAE